MIMKPLRWSGLMLLSVASLLVGCDSDPVQQDDDPPLTLDFILQDLDGQDFQLSETQGDVVVMHFFSPHCPVCRQEAPEYNRLYERFENELVTIVGIAVMWPQDDTFESFKANVEGFSDVFEVPYPILLDYDERTANPDDDVRNPVSDGYRISFVPATCFVAKTGTIDQCYDQGALLEDQLAQVVNRLLAE